MFNQKLSPLVTLLIRFVGAQDLMQKLEKEHEDKQVGCWFVWVILRWRIKILERIFDPYELVDIRVPIQIHAGIYLLEKANMVLIPQLFPFVARAIFLLGD